MKKILSLLLVCVMLFGLVACGNGKYAANGELIPMNVKVGDKVLMSKNAGQTIKVDGEEYTLAYESEIMAVAE